MRIRTEPPHALVAAATFLTPFGGGRGAPPPEAVAWFPVVGAGIGLATGLGWRVAARVVAPGVAGALACVTDAALTGALHLDGLADTADGLFAHASATDRLAIMAEPQVGSFGAVVLASALGLKAAALGASTPSPVALGALCASSRSLMALATRSLPYARPGGLASAFLPDATDVGRRDAARLAGAAGLLGAFVAATAVHGRRGALALVLGPLAGCGVVALARRRIGGFTGDVLGAAGVVCETVGLLVLSGSDRR